MVMVILSAFLHRICDTFYRLHNTPESIPCITQGEVLTDTRPEMAFGEKRLQAKILRLNSQLHNLLRNANLR